MHSPLEGKTMKTTKIRKVIGVILKIIPFVRSLLEQIDDLLDAYRSNKPPSDLNAEDRR